MNTVYTILAFLIGFTLMVVVHEWGHYITGRIFNVKIDEFAIGMGPKIYSKKGKKVLFSLRCIPIGGFVKFTGDGESYGEQGEANENDPDILPNIKVWKRFIIYAAGAFMNVVLGFVLLVILYLCIGTLSQTPQIGKLMENSPAERAGLAENDIIIKIDGTDIIQDNFNSANAQISAILNEGKTVVFTVNRNGDNVDVTVTPEYDEKDNRYRVGFYFSRGYVPTNLGRAISDATTMSGQMMSLIYTSIGNMIFKGEGLDQMSGPLGVITVISDATRESFISVVSIFAALSLNLAVVNMLPFPALDGGKCLLLVIEGIRRKPIKKEVEGWINLVGFAALMLLMVLLTVKDAINIF